MWLLRLYMLSNGFNALIFGRSSRPHITNCFMYHGESGKRKTLHLGCDRNLDEVNTRELIGLTYVIIQQDATSAI